MSNVSVLVSLLLPYLSLSLPRAVPIMIFLMPLLAAIFVAVVVFVVPGLHSIDYTPWIKSCSRRLKSSALTLTGRSTTPLNKTLD